MNLRRMCESNCFHYSLCKSKTNMTLCIKKQTNYSNAFILYINCLLRMNHYLILGQNYETFRIVFLFIYAVDQIFTRPPVAAVAPNINSGRVMRGHDLTNIKTMTKTNTFLILQTNKLWQSMSELIFGATAATGGRVKILSTA